MIQEISAGKDQKLYKSRENIPYFSLSISMLFLWVIQIIETKKQRGKENYGLRQILSVFLGSKMLEICNILYQQRRYWVSVNQKRLTVIFSLPRCSSHIIISLNSFDGFLVSTLICSCQKVRDFFCIFSDHLLWQRF